MVKYIGEMLFLRAYEYFSLYQQYELNYCSQGSTLNSASIISKKYWPRNVLDKWMGYVDDAIESLQSLKETDIALYNVYYRNVCAERAFISNALVKLHAESLGQDLRKYQQMLLDDLYLCNFGYQNLIADIEKQLSEG